jgi:hypothetical protein
LGGTLAVANGGTGVTTSTGSGNNVLSTSPTFVTPVLGTPTSVTLTNATGLPLTTGVTGTLPIANGGTGLTALGTGVQTAIGVNVGTAGAFVVNGGVLGTPSSGTVTNLTGTASININGTVGATTANTGAFTTLSASSTTTLTALTASTALALDASKNIVSVTNTGSGNNVLATSPTITGLTYTDAAGAAPAFSATMSTTQTLSNGTYTLVNFDTKTGGNYFDTNSNFNTTTHLFTPTVAGYYQVNVSMFFSNAGGNVYLLIYKNSGAIGTSYFANGVATGAVPSTSSICYCNGSTDTISVYAFQSSGASLSGNGGSGNAFFSAAMIRSA